MFETGNPIVRPPQALQFNAHAITELNRVLQPYLHRDQPQTAVEPATAEPVVEAPRVSSVEFNRVLWTAESMIASVMGLKTYEVSVFVNTGRYMF
ncbi:hypothetical protein DC522_09370 [Microvirga sp. KLBC 81]|uniref:hypothetical protein n=1 Tax=Microvirga sp. KLBC 81 TaxID=1862707 RepID=UPI000D51E0C4|nr:hypothetical protein [Microvirga sp. KLBC 81]PVE24548.1 hypothetical protein DC522_09370 [Microvirga sp. KLBC 81]